MAPRGRAGHAHHTTARDVSGLTKRLKRPSGYRSKGSRSVVPWRARRSFTYSRAGGSSCF